MPRTRHILTLTSTALALACGGETQPANSEPTLRAALVSYDSAWNAKDTATLDTLLAPEYLYFSSRGELSKRAKTMAFVADTTYAIVSSHRSEVEVTFEGSVARVSSRWEGKGRYQGEVVNDDQTCGLTWIQRGGRWLLFTEHCTDRVAPAPVAGD